MDPSEIQNLVYRVLRLFNDTCRYLENIVPKDSDIRGLRNQLGDESGQLLRTAWPDEDEQNSIRGDLDRCEDAASVPSRPLDGKELETVLVSLCRRYENCSNLFNSYISEDTKKNRTLADDCRKRFLPEYESVLGGAGIVQRQLLIGETFQKQNWADCEMKSMVTDNKKLDSRVCSSMGRAYIYNDKVLIKQKVGIYVYEGTI